MMHKYLSAACLAACLYSSPASASLDNVGDLLSHCKIAVTLSEEKPKASTVDAMKAGICMGYVYGFSQAQVLGNELGSAKMVCYPKGVLPFQMIRVFIKWANANPEHHHESPG